MATVKVTVMFLQNLDKNTNTELHNTDNEPWKIRPKNVKRLASICNKEDWESLSEKFEH